VSKMKDEQEDMDFEKLRKLLELKRHEVPPPGYFEDFSATVIARIEAEDARPATSWWQRLLPGIDTSPVMLGAYGVIAGSLIIAGVQLTRPAASEDVLQGAPRLSSSGSPGSIATPDPVSPQADPAPAILPVAARNSDAGTTGSEILKTLGNEVEHVARTAPTGLFDPPSIHSTSQVERVSFPAKQ